MEPLLFTQGLQAFQIFPVFCQVSPFVGFQRHGEVLESGIVDQELKTVKTYTALADMGMPVNSAAAVFL